MVEFQFVPGFLFELWTCWYWLDVCCWTYVTCSPPTWFWLCATIGWLVIWCVGEQHDPVVVGGFWFRWRPSGSDMFTMKFFSRYFRSSAVIGRGVTSFIRVLTKIPGPRANKSSRFQSRPRIPTVKLKIPRKSRIQKFCYIQVIVFDLSYLPVAAVGT